MSEPPVAGVPDSDQSGVSPKVPRSEALPQGVPEGAKDVFATPPVGDGARPPEQIEGQSAALTTFLRFHPFMAFFCWLAHLQFDADQPSHRRISAHRRSSPKLYWLCVCADIVLTLAVTGTIVATAIGVAFKTLFA